MYPNLIETAAIGGEHGPLLECGPAEARRVRSKPFLMCEYVHAMGNGPGAIAEYDELAEQYGRLHGGFVWEWRDHGLLTHAADGTPYYGYGGDFGEVVHDGNFVMDGMVLPDDTPTPGLAEFAAVSQPVIFTLDGGTLGVRSRYHTTDTVSPAVRGPPRAGRTDGRGERAGDADRAGGRGVVAGAAGRAAGLGRRGRDLADRRRRAGGRHRLGRGGARRGLRPVRLQRHRCRLSAPVGAAPEVGAGGRRRRARRRARRLRSRHGTAAESVRSPGRRAAAGALAGSDGQRPVRRAGLVRAGRSRRDRRRGCPGTLVGAALAGSRSRPAHAPGAGPDRRSGFARRPGTQRRRGRGAVRRHHLHLDRGGGRRPGPAGRGQPVTGLGLHLATGRRPVRPADRHRPGRLVRHRPARVVPGHRSRRPDRPVRRRHRRAERGLLPSPGDGASGRGPRARARRRLRHPAAADLGGRPRRPPPGLHPHPAHAPGPRPERAPVRAPDPDATATCSSTPRSTASAPAPAASTSSPNTPSGPAPTAST